MAVNLPGLAADVRLNGLDKTMGGFRQFNERLEQSRKGLLAMRKGLLAVAAGFFFLINSGTLAGAMMGGLGSAFGFIIDTLFLLLAPAIEWVTDKLFEFGEWFANQGPVVKSIGLGLAVGLALAFTALSAPVVLAIAGFAALAALILNSGPKTQAVVLALAVAFGIFWAVATGGILPLIVALGLLVVAVVKNWDKIKEAFRSAIDRILGWLQPLIDAVKTVGGALGGIGGAVGGAINAGRGIIGLADGGIVTRPTLAVVGEAGPEAVVPLRGGGGGGTSTSFDQSIGPVTVIASDANSGARIGEEFAAQMQMRRRLD